MIIVKATQIYQIIVPHFSPNFYIYLDKTSNFPRQQISSATSFKMSPNPQKISIQLAIFFNFNMSFQNPILSLISIFSQLIFFLSFKASVNPQQESKKCPILKVFLELDIIEATLEAVF
ncbi:hypothetical protein PPERSA_08022 [Pseudocohnilembus persalinus]|uniref:Uncharacterized protein n=1 Tax=Pseudocohnilembus persalinus TaxID=266149 RepID=A0A0V0R2H9_PSEPJ|nr:hypothetical protein PPERSA_08022 [Pseudocohnilembus persalinus]|eukprot:KRX08711.1 hypothetical protein PPERSA_08022 [Pseudocohnilembus persalinus]